MDCANLGAKAGTWRVNGVPHDMHICRGDGRECFPGGEHPTGHNCSESCPLYAARAVPEFWKVDVVVTAYGYGRFLTEALDSVAAQDKSVLGRVIVVDPDEQGQAICEARGVKFLQTDFKSPHLSRGAGFAECFSPLVMFLDADNRMRRGYLLEAAKLFHGNQRLAIVYPNLAYFGDKAGALEQPATHDAARFERLNTIDTGSVWLRQAIQQVQPFTKDPKGFEDWRLAREVLRSGRFEAAKNSISLHYRQHGANRLREVMKQGYYSFAGLADECVTIFTTFSQRIQKSPELWERRKAWLREQSWPRIRLVVANTSHEPLPAGWSDGLPAIDVSSYTHAVGLPGGEDIDRRQVQTEIDAQTAVAAIYNRMWQETRDEFVLVLEDDVFPERLDAIEAMMRCFDKTICAVSGAYQQRYFPYSWTAWQNTPEDGRPKLIEAQAEASQPKPPRQGVQLITGSGFGCVLLRRSQVASEVITGNTSISRYYDTDLFERLNRQGKRVRLNWDVWCEHAGEIVPPNADQLAALEAARKANAERVGDRLSEVLGECGISKPGCPSCLEWIARMNGWGIDGCQQHRAEILKRLDSEAKQATWIQWAKVAVRGYTSSDSLLDEAIKRAAV